MSEGVRKGSLYKCRDKNFIKDLNLTGGKQWQSG